MIHAVHPRGEPGWKPSIKNFMESKKVVMVDQFHHNYHRVDSDAGTLNGLCDTLALDGYTYVINKQEFTKDSLKGIDTLFITGASADWYMVADKDNKAYTNASKASNWAFTRGEAELVSDWVSSGGNLLLVFDHTPFGPSNQVLASEFGATFPSQVGPMRFGNLWAFNYRGDTLPKHPIFTGRNKDEEITKLSNFQLNYYSWPWGETLLTFPPFTQRLYLSPDGWDLFWHSANTFNENGRIPIRMVPSLIAASSSQNIAGLPALSYVEHFRKKAADKGGRVLIVGEQNKFVTNWTGSGGLQDPNIFKLVVNMLRWTCGDI